MGDPLGPEDILRQLDLHFELPNERDVRILSEIWDGKGEKRRRDLNSSTKESFQIWGISDETATEPKLIKTTFLAFSAKERKGSLSGLAAVVPIPPMN